MARTLIYIPVWHTKADWGNTLCVLDTPDAVRHRTEAHWNMIDVWWNLIESSLRNMDIAWGTISVFSDTVFEDSAEMICALALCAQRGSKHCAAIIDLWRRGAHIEKTEEEYLIRADRAHRYKTEFYLMQRDRAIAAHINRKLQNDKTGILFVGNGHIFWKRFLLPEILAAPLIDRLVEEAFRKAIAAL